MGFIVVHWENENSLHNSRRNRNSNNSENRNGHLHAAVS